MSTIREEQRFLQHLQALVREGRTQGGVVTETALDSFREELGLGKEQMAQVRAYLGQSGIRITDAADTAQAEPSGEPAEADVTESGAAPVSPAAGMPGSFPEDALTPEGDAYLREYEEMVRSMSIPSDGVMDALRLSAMAGERQAQRDLAQYSLSKVLDVARLYVSQGVSAEELVSAGNEALTIAVTLLAPLEGPDEVDSFLVSRIMGAMEDLVAENLDRRSADREMEELVNKVADKAQQLSDLLGRKITREELIREGEVTREEIDEAMRLTGRGIEAFGEQDRS